MRGGASSPPATGFVDLHSHFVPDIDDGVRTALEARALVVGLRRIGFTHVVATPHMRPGMFDNDAHALRTAFDAVIDTLAADADAPSLGLACEHFFDDTVFARLVKHEGIPYAAVTPTQRRQSVLVELPPHAFPVRLAERMFDLGRARLRPVIAHPERYQPVWHDDRCLDPLIDAGACLLLDVCALVGKYGEAPERAALALVKSRAYEAACSDAHRPDDVEITAQAILVLRKVAGDAEAERLLGAGPRAILAGSSS